MIVPLSHGSAKSEHVIPRHDVLESSPGHCFRLLTLRPYHTDAVLFILIPTDHAWLYARLKYGDIMAHIPNTVAIFRSNHTVQAKYA